MTGLSDFLNDIKNLLDLIFIVLIFKTRSKKNTRGQTDYSLYSRSLMLNDSFPGVLHRT